MSKKTFQATKIKDDLYFVGAHDFETRQFDLMMTCEFGTTYNSFLLKGTKDIVLFETVKNKEKFGEQLVGRIRSALKKNERITKIVFDHTEPDHSGYLKKFLTFEDIIDPEVTIYGTKKALKYIREIHNMTFKSVIVDLGDELDIGGKTLQFLRAKHLHWPDTMITYCPEIKTLFTCDFFGTHYCNDHVIDEDLAEKELKEYWSTLKGYFDPIFGPYKKCVTEGLELIKDLEYDTICVSHGPVLRKYVQKVQDLYQNWAKIEKLKDKIVLVYISAYGGTAEMARYIQKGIESVGDVELVTFDMETATKKQVFEEFEDAKGIIIGTPTMVGDALPQIWDIALGLNPVLHGKKRYGAAFGTYGWSGEGVRNIDIRLVQCKLILPLNPLRVKLKSSGKNIEQTIEYGKKFARAVKGEEIKERTLLSEYPHGGLSYM
ncbi:diflavin flavoprotein a 2-related [Anaeramoeba flamelloides]|uniref:Diflavin flavoprotein a 2-related n=1 Tax=Anaeramoeba flamelloides TaxID=1746091 RepID=A0AAV7YWU1_9EUKA|nr:diflavin flavoprotein a 2-related [Anaeramoeba flamelloides]